MNVNVNLADQMWNNDKCRCKCENPKQPNACKKNYVWNPTACSWENVEYLTSNIDGSVIM